MKRPVGLYAGSFDPITSGHVDVVRAAAAFCGRIVVAIGVHPGKAPLFSLEEKTALIVDATREIARSSGCDVEVASFDGLAVNGSARVVGWLSGVVRRVQSGYLYHYAFAMIIGLSALIAWYVLR